ncbi:MAG: YiiX/YebB-like N1pC/P60 family cysteine hydrolase [Endozoicomonas sp.]
MQVTGLQRGDLLFQLRTGGELEWIISRIFAGHNGMALNHVAIYSGSDELIEAIMPEVRRTPVREFASRSVADGVGHPCLIQARLLPEYSHLIPAALSFSEQQLEQPYDSAYGSHQESWYCSKLIVDAFRYANNGDFLFPETSMGFRDMETGELFTYWVDHYRKLDKPVPEGMPGSHPALLSCSPLLEITRVFGQLPARRYHLAPDIQVV